MDGGRGWTGCGLRVCRQTGCGQECVHPLHPHLTATAAGSTHLNAFLLIYFFHITDRYQEKTIVHIQPDLSELNMAKVELLHTLQTTEFELSTLGKTLTEIDFPDVFAKNCQFILENTVFIKALAEIKNILKEFMKSKTRVTDDPDIKKYQLRTRKERKYIKIHERSLVVNLTEELSDLKNKGLKNITGNSLFCTQCQQESCACNHSTKLSASQDHEQNVVTIKRKEDLTSGKYTNLISTKMFCMLCFILYLLQK